MKWSVDTAKDATADIVQNIQNLAKTKHSILLLVSGGSAISIETDVIRQLQDCPNILGVLPIDERFGPQGHADSNIAALLSQIPLTNSVALHDILAQNVSFDQTVEYYSSLTQDLFSKADYIVGIFGVGTDGHTAGILPNSPASTDTVATVIGYSWNDYERMTLGISSLLQIDTAFVLAYGPGKKNAIEKLYEKTEPFESLPAKLLYDIADVTIYNDYIKNEG